MGKYQEYSQAAFRFTRFSPAYRSRLIDGLQDLQTFCGEKLDLSLSAVLRSKPRVVDKILGTYVISRHESSSGSSLSKIKHALLGCQHLVPRLRGHISTAWENLRVWEEKRVSRLRPPLPIPLWCVMTGLARAHGYATNDTMTRRCWLTFAILLELGLLCMLRPGELMRLRHSDFAMPGDFSLGQTHGAVRNVAPKNRRHFGAEQFVMVKHPNVIMHLRHLLITDSDDLLWDLKPHRFKVLFKQIIVELKLESLRLTPGSLRPGGATLYYAQGIPISQLRFMGRWTVEKSLEHYIQQAMSAQILNRLSPVTIAKLKKVGSQCLDLLVCERCRHLVERLPKHLRQEGSAIVAWCSKYAKLGEQAWKDRDRGRPFAGLDL